MRRDLELLYEKTLIEEEIGALNYWLSPTGDLLKVDDHIGYAIKNFDLSHIEDEDEIYNAVYMMGYSRVVEQPATIYVTYNRSKPPNRKQFEVLYGMAMDKNKNLVDGETQKVIVKNNEIEPDVARNAQLDQMDKDLQPSFYKNRRNYGESFAKYDLNDYTKIIYEDVDKYEDFSTFSHIIQDANPLEFWKNQNEVLINYILKNSYKFNPDLVKDLNYRKDHYLKSNGNGAIWPKLDPFLSDNNKNELWDIYRKTYKIFNDPTDANQEDNYPLFVTLYDDIGGKTVKLKTFSVNNPSQLENAIKHIYNNLDKFGGKHSPSVVTTKEKP